ncbi:tetratricopeptide repeat protein 27 [Chrysoperla carnea]|uniref:tetratricopeptide repeat protein 27 n=1 Tax=Chrysoperla carnea TaxID=189513 RepID=UPI001D079823|nr:tetratricopeptide repeat protein 27 [Chrysoperla carnea]
MFSLNNDIKHLLLYNYGKQLNLELNSPFLSKLNNGDFIELLNESDDFSRFLNDQQINLIDCDNLDKFIEYLSIAISSLTTFVQLNWIGPPTVYENTTDTQFYKQALSLDGEEINENVQNPELLYISRKIIEQLHASEILVLIWKLRIIFVHQSIIDERCISLFEEFNNTINQIKIDEFENPRDQASFYIQISHMLIYYGRITEAEEYINKAKTCLGMQIEVIGDMGKRTRYQTKSLAQVRIKVLVDSPNVEIEENLPEIIKLNDDVRLDSIQWDNSGNDIVVLSGLEQALLLVEVAYRRKAMPQDELINEEIQPILDYVLKQENCWLARFVALISKCRLESSHKRTIERALNQSETLINTLNSGGAPLVQRLNNFWTLSPITRWNIEAQLADMMLSLGLVKAALDIFLKLSLWEDVIVCYTILQLRHKAAEIIRQELEKKKSVKLLCLLGDALDDVQLYEEAWELSERKSARPHRHWGQFLFAKKEYEACIPHLQQSLEINSLQATVWLRLGYAALSVEKWDIAANAYRRYTTIEPNCFEAWNNLARVYIAQGDKNRAYKAFNEALKTSFDNWQVWENFMLTSIDTGHFEDAIRSYHRLLDLKEKHLDTEVLIILVEAILKHLPNHDGGDSARLTQKCLELLGRVTAIFQNEFKPWELYATLTTDNYLRVQRFQRAHRALIQDSNWPKDMHKCCKVIDNCIKLGENCLTLTDESLKSSVRLSLKAALKGASKEQWTECANSLSELEKIVEELCK